MEIPVTVGNKTYYLCSEEGQFSLCKEVNITDKKTNQTRVDKQGFKFYPTLSIAIRSLFELKISTSTAQSFHALQQDIDKANKELQGLYEHHSK